MVGAHHTPARILANVVIWAFMVYGFLFLAAFKDYTMGFALAILSLCTAVPNDGSIMFLLTGRKFSARSSPA